jgi:osmotically-inducible protein OsmY
VPRDVEIAREALRTLRSIKSAPAGVQVTADHGWLALDGRAETKHQKLAASRAVRGLPGVLGVTNRLTLPASVVIDEIEARILDAFKRVALSDAQGIDIEVTDDEVVLRGYVQSEAERAQAGEVAHAAPGVGRVTNELVVRPF